MTISECRRFAILGSTVKRVVDQERGSEAPPGIARAPVYSQPDDVPLTSSRLIAITRHATDVASQARGIEHGDILLGVAGTVQLWGWIRLEEPDLIAYLIADACQ